MLCNLPSEAGSSASLGANALALQLKNAGQLAFRGEAHFAEQQAYGY